MVFPGMVFPGKVNFIFRDPEIFLTKILFTKFMSQTHLYHILINFELFEYSLTHQQMYTRENLKLSPGALEKLKGYLNQKYSLIN
jgi:hypothetical protein